MTFIQRTGCLLLLTMSLGTAFFGMCWNAERMYV